MIESLSPEEQEQLQSIYEDPEKFVRLLMIPRKKDGVKIPFVPNAGQQKILTAIKAGKRKIICVKCRQVGFSTVFRGVALWRVYCAAGSLEHGVTSFHEKSAKGMRRTDKMMYHSLPTLLKRRLSVDNTETMEFEGTGARLSSYTASSKYGTRSFVLQGAHVTEFSFYEDQKKFLREIDASVGTGDFWIESTVEKAGDMFQKLAFGAPDNGWTLITHWWWEHDEYWLEPPPNFEPTDEEKVLVNRYDLDNGQLYWRRIKLSTMELEDFRKEYPACLEDAFHTNEHTFLSLDDLAKIQEREFPKREKVYDEPKEYDMYALGADVAAGVGLDYSAITVMSLSTLQVVYQWRSNTINPSEFSEKIIEVGLLYNEAKVLVESNNHGHLVLYKLEHYEYPNLWTDAEGKHWVTSVKSKLEAFDLLREYVRNQIFLVLCHIALAELRALIVKKICPEAGAGMTDDIAMSMALCCICIRDIPRHLLEKKKQGVLDMLLFEVKRKRARQGVLRHRKD